MKLICVYFILSMVIDISAFAQTKMIINKTDGTADSVLLSSIKNIAFTSTSANHQILFQEGFENGNLSFWNARVTSPVITTLEHVSPTHSLTLPPGRADYSCIYKNFTDSLSTGTVGLELKMMKKTSTAAQAFYAVFYQKRANNPSYSRSQLVVGFGGGSQKDSLTIQNYTASPEYAYSKSIGKIKINEWHKLAIEFDFSTKKAAYFLDDMKVDERIFDLTYLDSILFGDQDTDGADIGNTYFVDDIILYKKL